MSATPDVADQAAVNGLQQNRIVEPEFELRRRNVRAIVFRQSTELNGSFAVAVLRQDTPYQIFPCEICDYAFSLADLNDLVSLLEVAKTWLESQANKRHLQTN
jgi:hypothetical protein